MPIHGKSVQFEKPPMGLNQAVIAGVFDIGTQTFTWEGKTSSNPQIVICLELDAKQEEGDYAGQPFRIYKFNSLYMSRNAKLRKDVQSILGKVMSDAEAAALDLESLVGTNCYVSLIENEGKYKIDSFAACPQKLPKLKPTLTDEPEFITKKRTESEEVKNGDQIRSFSRTDAPYSADMDGNAADNSDILPF